MICVAAALIGSDTLSQFAAGLVHGSRPAGSVAPPAFRVPAPPPAVCGSKAVLGAGPAVAPAGAVTVPAGDDSGLELGKPHTTYWFAPGVHTLGGNEYKQIAPGNYSAYIGAPGAILDGKHTNDYAFGGYSEHVTISYLTVRNFGYWGDNEGQGIVNHNSAGYWTIDHSTVTDNAGAGVMLGSGDTLSDDCLKDNQQYGFNAYSPTGVIRNLTITRNEITGNDTYNWEQHQHGCGCTGGGKFWDVDGAVITGNWVHDNNSAGLWADTDNRGFQITGNYIAGNYSYGLIYEISYNAEIAGNTFVKNGLGEGPKNPGFPTSAIYISESGGDSAVPGRFSGELSITRNTFMNNWSGVILWENSNRFCGSPANTSTSFCTLVNPRKVTLDTCDQAHITKAPYYTACRWKTQNVSVNGNVFDFSPVDVGSTCTAATECGFVGVFSEFGTYPSWSPYHGLAVEKQITFYQNNHFTANTYNGPWQFMVLAQGNVVPWLTWRSNPYVQDKGSVLHTSVG